jgi:hypothetical protein
MSKTAKVTEVVSRSVLKRSLGDEGTVRVVSTPKRVRRSGRAAFDFDTTNYPSPQGGF